MADVRIDELEDGIVLVTIDRPERRNALSGNVLAELHRTFDIIGGDPTMRVVIVTGAGESFCAGADDATAVHPRSRGRQRREASTARRTPQT